MPYDSPLITPVLITPAVMASTAAPSQVAATAPPPAQVAATAIRVVRPPAALPADLARGLVQLRAQDQGARPPQDDGPPAEDAEGYSGPVSALFSTALPASARADAPKGPPPAYVPLAGFHPETAPPAGALPDAEAEDRAEPDPPAGAEQDPPAPAPAAGAWQAALRILRGDGEAPPPQQAGTTNPPPTGQGAPPG